MPFNGTGTFVLTTSGQPVVTQTIISTTMFNGVLDEVEVGLSTCITKDGQTTATASIPFAAGISVTGLATLNNAVVLNESGGDNDIRIESDTDANHFVSDAGLFGGVGAFAFGAGVNDKAFISISPPAYTAVADQNVVRVLVNNSSAITVPTGTAPVAATLFVAEPNLVATGTITAAASIYVEAAPTEGGENYAIFVEAGDCRFDGGMRFGTHTGIGSETVTGFITITDAAGNTRKLAVVS